MNKKALVLATLVIVNVHPVEATPQNGLAKFIVLGISATFVTFAAAFGIKYGTERAAEKKLNDDFELITATSCLSPSAEFKTLTDILQIKRQNALIHLADYCAAHGINIETLCRQSEHLFNDYTTKRKLLTSKLEYWDAHQEDLAKRKAAQNALNDTNITRLHELYQITNRYLQQQKTFLSLYVTHHVIAQKTYQFTGKFADIAAVEAQRQDFIILRKNYDDLKELIAHTSDTYAHEKLLIDMSSTISNLGQAIHQTTSQPDFQLRLQQKDLAERQATIERAEQERREIEKNKTEIERKNAESNLIKLQVALRNYPGQIANLEATIRDLRCDLRIKEDRITQLLRAQDRAREQEEELAKIKKEKNDVQGKLDTLEKKVKSVREKMGKIKQGYNPEYFAQQVQDNEIIAAYIRLENDLA